jgi:hypothetical protein
MIVRIFTEGQYRLDDSLHGKLNELDDAVVAAVDGDDEDGYHAGFEELLEFVRSNGSLVGDDELESSSFLLPPPDLSFVEAQKEFTGDGLIPDPPA